MILQETTIMDKRTVVFSTPSPQSNVDQVLRARLPEFHKSNIVWG